MTYGFDDRAEVRADAVTQEGPRMRFELCLPDGTCTPVTLALPGRHNVQNALAAAAVAWQLGIPAEAIASALEKFQGIGRRFRSEEHTSELQSLMRSSYAVFCLKKKKDKI